MRIAEMSWMQVERQLERDDRAVVPIGSTEQHAYLSLATDSLLAERVAVEAAEPLRVPVFPCVAYGIAPVFSAYPGSISLRIETLVAVVRDVLESLAGSGFRRVLIVNGHGGNVPIQAFVSNWTTRNPGVAVRFHSWWNAPLVWARVQELDPQASHASWMENFPWTRLAAVAMPAERKPMLDVTDLKSLEPAAVRERLGDGSFGGLYQRPDSEMESLWQVAVAETRMRIEGDWGRA